MMRVAFFDPGTLDKRVVLEAPVEISDGCGGLELSWSEVASIWASVQPIKPVVEQQAQQSTETLQHKVLIRFRTDVASGWRLRWNERLLDINSVYDPDERQRYLVCMTEEEGR